MACQPEGVCGFLREIPPLGQENPYFSILPRRASHGTYKKLGFGSGLYGIQWVRNSGIGGLLENKWKKPHLNQDPLFVKKKKKKKKTSFLLR